MRIFKTILPIVLFFVSISIFAHDAFAQNKGIKEKTFENNVLRRNRDFDAKQYAKLNRLNYVEIRDITLDFALPNTVYVINKSYDLKGQSLEIPFNSILFFKEGSLSNGYLKGNNTRVVSTNRVIFNPGKPTFRGYNTDNGEYHFEMDRKGAVVLSGTWINTKCGDNWTGLNEIHTDCASIAINNFITLHDITAIVRLPKSQFFIYLPLENRNHSIDFSGSMISLIAYSLVDDSEIALPQDVKQCPLKHPGELFTIAGDSLTISNFSIDGGSLYENNVASSLGVEHSIRIHSCVGGSLNNVVIQNTIGCGVAMNNSTADYTFQNVTWNNIGEHGVYTHTPHGYVKFTNCRFKNCGQSEAINRLRNGYSACVRPSLVTEKCLKNHSVSFLFDSCSFVNDGNIPVLTCYGGGSYYEYTNCSWDGRMLGYSETTRLPDELGHCIEHVFIKCKNPVSRYSGYNTIRRMYDCAGVKNLFEDLVEAHNCDCLLSYSDVYNEYRNGLNPGEVVVIDSCRFTAGNDRMPRVVIHNPRPIHFSNCSFDYDNEDVNSDYKGKFIIIKGGKTIPFVFSNCEFRSSINRLVDLSVQNIQLLECYKIVGNNKTKAVRLQDLAF